MKKNVFNIFNNSKVIRRGKFQIFLYFLSDDIIKNSSSADTRTALERIQWDLLSKALNDSELKVILNIYINEAEKTSNGFIKNLDSFEKARILLKKDNMNFKQIVKATKELIDGLNILIY